MGASSNRSNLKRGILFIFLKPEERLLLKLFSHMDVQAQQLVAVSKDIEERLGVDYKRLASLTRKWEELGFVAINNLGQGEYQCKLTPTGLNTFRLLRKKQTQERYFLVITALFLAVIGGFYFGL